MPGGNWDYNQNLNAGQVEWPTGPLTVAPTGTEIPTWVEAWVLQRATGASQRTVQSSGWVTGQWTADGHVWREGRFQAGPALGIALVSTRDSATNPPTARHYWWIDMINLN